MPSQPAVESRVHGRGGGQGAGREEVSPAESSARAFPEVSCPKQQPVCVSREAEETYLAKEGVSRLRGQREPMLNRVWAKVDPLQRHNFPSEAARPQHVAGAQSPSAEPHPGLLSSHSTDRTAAPTHLSSFSPSQGKLLEAQH